MSIFFISEEIIILCFLDSLFLKWERKHFNTMDFQVINNKIVDLCYSAKTDAVVYIYSCCGILIHVLIRINSCCDLY